MVVRISDKTQNYSKVTKLLVKPLKIGYNDISYEKLESFYHCVSYLRNQCCHYQRLYRKNHPIKPKLYTPSNINLGSFVSGSTYSLVLPLLYINPNQSLGKRAIEKLKNRLNRYIGDMLIYSTLMMSI